MKLAWYTTVDDVSEKTFTLRGDRSVSGEAVLTSASAGWYIRLNTISLFVGEEKPPFEKGDFVKLTLEHDVKQEKHLEKADDNKA